jgi:glycogen debranching enzyme
MISLAPLTGIIGAHEFEKEVLEQQLSLIREGLVPNLITEDGTALYNSIDAVLLLFVAVHRMGPGLNGLRYPR